MKRVSRIRLPFFYGWVVVASCFVLLGLSYTVWYSFSVFYVAILGEFGWSRALTAGVFSVFMLVNGLAGPACGALIDRYGTRRIVSLGTLVLAAGLAGCSRLSQLWHFYLFFGVVVALGMTATSWIPNVTLLSNWFVRRLGTVIGIATAGMGFGMLLLVPLVQYLISSVGWRDTYLLLAVSLLLVMLPTTLLFQRHRPQDMGLLPDGEASASREQRPGSDDVVVDRAWAAIPWTLGRAAATARFQLAFAWSFLMSFAIQTALVHQVALLTDAGYDKMLAAAAVGTVGIASALGKMGWGTASDRVGRELAFSLGVVCGVIGVLLLALARTVQASWLPYAYGLWMGLGYGALAPLMPAVLADLFRGRSFGALFGLLSLGGATGGALSSWLAGYVFDLTGDYLLALVIALGAMLASCACLWLAAPRQVRLVPGRVRRRYQPG